MMVKLCHFKSCPPKSSCVRDVKRQKVCFTRFITTNRCSTQTVLIYLHVNIYIYYNYIYMGQ